MQLIFKTSLAGVKPYSTLSGDEYLALLQKNETAICQGSFGVYLARKVVVENQELYQPLIDIDGAAGLEGNQKTESAIQFAHATLKALNSLGAADHFKFLATGATGFRALSNLLFNCLAYIAFVDWMRFEMPHLHDLKPTVETDNPHQAFAYKGDSLHTVKGLIDGHSTVIEKNLLTKGVFTISDYLQITAGKPDPGEIMLFVKWLLSGPIISDLKALGPLGDRLHEYQRISSDFNVNPFSYVQLRSQIEPIGLTAMQEMLTIKGILSKIEKRGKNQAISFWGLPCPVCGKVGANARAYPPFYKLKCFNTNCGAHNGMPLHRWFGIKKGGQGFRSPKNGFDLSVPDKYVSLEDARDLIAEELNNRDDSLFVVTPGVGKTHAALQAISKIGKDRIVIYAAFNKDLQKEAYNQICKLEGRTDGFYLLEPREQTCQRSRELKNVTSMGFSPSEILCAGCDYRGSNCEYYNQRREFVPGVYFVTLHMLQYLHDQIPTPDLIILDENLKAGLLLEDSCRDLEIKSVLKIVQGADAALIRQLLNMIQLISTKMVESGSQAMIINGRKLTQSDIKETTIIELLAKSMNRSEEEVFSSLKTFSNTLDKLSRPSLYRKGIDLNAVNWIKGLCSPSALSFVHISDKGDVKYSTKRITRFGYHGTPIKILDATGDASASSAPVKRKLKTVKADVSWNSYRVHIKIDTSRKVMYRSRESDLKKLLSEMLSHTQANRIMVATYMRHEKQILKILETIDSTRDFKGYHFIGPRGINTYQDCDAVLVIGLPYSNLNSAAQDACILFPNEKDADKRMDWAEACMQWDLVQAIHRIRPVHKAFDSSRCISFKDKGEFLKDMRFKLILVIYNIYNQNSLKHEILYDQLLNLSKNQHDDWSNTDMILSNRNQWASLLIHFKEINPHFETFKIKIPHARGNAVTGVGNQDRAKEFYRQINDLGIVGKIDIDSYKVVDQSKYAVRPIPDGFLSIYIPDGEDTAFIGWDSEFAAIPLYREPSRLRTCFESMLKDPQIKIVTNNGKHIAKAFLSCGLPACEIIDVIITEKLIANGEPDFHVMNLKTVFKRHGFSEGLERSMVVNRLVDVWCQQETLIQNGGLEKIFDIEKRLIWVTAQIESTGIGIDVDAVLGFHDVLTDKLKNLAAVLEKMIPKGISLNDRFRMKEHLNSTYSLSLAEIDDESIKTITNAGIKSLCCELAEYWKTVREKSDVEYYLSITGHDDRVRDSIDQLNTKTGRFYRRLQTVNKVGSMRSLFRARNGYKFIVADYSQQEKRIIAGLSNDQVAIDQFKAGKDIYLETAKIIMGSGANGRLYRNLGKEIFLGLNNGRSAYSIYESLERLGFGYDVDDVMGMILRYDMTFTGIRTWRDNIGSKNLEGGVISTALGRSLKISSDMKVNSLYNYPVQGTAADGFKIALIDIDRQLDGQDARIVHICTDALNDFVYSTIIKFSVIFKTANYDRLKYNRSHIASDHYNSRKTGRAIRGQNDHHSPQYN